jgi:SAM-dependent methyltransferase
VVWLASLPPGARDAEIERYLGIDAPSIDASPPGHDLVGYHASGVAPIVRALLEVPVSGDDVFVDLGAGLGKVALLTALLTGARVHGIELQAPLAARAAACAERLGVDARFTAGDVRDADLDDGTVFFLYAPFTGAVLGAVLDRLRRVAAKRAIVVCALAIDLDRAPWLARRDVDAFWLTLYDSRIAGAAPRAARGRSPLPPGAELLAFERARPA